MSQKPQGEQPRTTLHDLSEESSNERALTPEQTESVKGGMIVYEEDPSDFGSTKGE